MDKLELKGCYYCDAADPGTDGCDKCGRDDVDHYWKHGRRYKSYVTRKWYCVATSARGVLLVPAYTRATKVRELALSAHIDQDGACPRSNVRLVTRRGRRRAGHRKEIPCQTPLPITSVLSFSN